MSFIEFTETECLYCRPRPNRKDYEQFLAHDMATKYSSYCHVDQGIRIHKSYVHTILAK